MHFTALRIVTFVALIVTACICFVVYHYAGSIVRSIANGRLPLVPGGQSLDQYKQLPVNLTQNIYIFNITNYDGFMRGDIPSLEELGPYTFSSVWVKNMSWDKDQLQFHENRTFYFLPHLSNGTLDDPIVTVDIVLMGALQIIEKLPKWIQIFIKPLLNLRKVLCKHKVREFLYEGYPDFLAKAGKIIEPNLPVIDGKVGYLLGKNGTNDGLYSVFSGGNGHLDKLNLITQLANSSTISYYDAPCNDFRGTNGELYPPFDESLDHIDVYNPMFCRPWTLYKNGTATVGGVESTFFSSGDVMFSSTGNKTLDSCYEKNPYGVKGTFDASACQFGQPVVFSLPHFYKGDPSLLEQVHGLHPEAAKHDFSLNVFKFGITTDFKIRLQVSVRDVQYDPALNRGPKVLYPVLWQELVLQEKDLATLNDIVYKQAVKPQIILEGVLIALGSVLLASFIIIAITFYVIDRKGVKRVDDQEPIVQHDESANYNH